jgi:hypothetical protein
MEASIDTIEKVDNRRNPDGNQNYDVTRIWESHNEIIRLLVAGVSPTAIARTLNITTQTVSNVRNSPLAQQRISELAAQRDAEAIDIAKRVAEIAPLAVDVLKKHLVDALDNDENDKDVARIGTTAALGLLDHAVPRKVEGRVLHGHMTLDRINEIKQKALVGMQQAVVVEETSDESK